MSLNTIDIKKITEELSLIIEEGKVEKIYQHSENDLIISIYKKGNKYRLYFYLTSGLTRLHLISNNLAALPVPSSFIMLMRKYLKNSIIKDIKQINTDRIVKLEFGTKTTTFYLIVELMDKSANVYFLNSDEKILGFFKYLKDIKIGKIYKLPKKSEIDINTLSLSIKEQSDGAKLYNEIIEEKYGIKTEKKDSNFLKQTLTSRLKKEIKKIKRLITNLKEDLQKANLYEKYKKNGQLLQTYFYLMKKGMREIELKDYESKEKILITLDPELSPQNNIGKYFKKAKKYKSAKKIIPEKIKEAEKNLKILLFFLEKLTNIKEKQQALIELNNIKVENPAYYYKYFEKIHNSLKNNDSLISRKKKEKNKTVSGFRYFISSTGKKIYVARNSRENDELTFKFAKGNNDWLHTRDYPGSHVIVSLSKNEKIDGKTLNEALQLALHFSKAKNNKSADVYYTKRKFLTKAKNSPVGKVNLSKYQIYNVIFNKEVLDKIVKNKNE